jgi:hypothetical protein
MLISLFFKHSCKNKVTFCTLESLLTEIKTLKAELFSVQEKLRVVKIELTKV